MKTALCLAGLLMLLGITTAGSTMPSLDGATAWLDGPPVSGEQLHGKVVLIDFWEYTCLNCLRTLPYLREWYRRYHDDGFEIIGIQTPEFAFSGESANVRKAMSALGITWPVAIDDRLTLWHRFGVGEWPTEMLFDRSGRLVLTHTGEGGYPEFEALIQQQLLDANPHLSMPKPMALLPQDNYVKPGAVCYPKTPEIVMAAARLGDPPQNQDQDSMQLVTYNDTGSHRDGTIYLEGAWSALRQSVEYEGGNGYFDVPYHAIAVSVVMTPGGKQSRVDVTQDGKALAREDAGADVRYDAAGKSYVIVDASRSYDVVMNAKFGNYDLQLSPRDPGLRIYDVDFESCEVPK